MRLLTSGFFHESIVPGPWIHMLKYFRKYFRFRGDIHKIRFFCSDFWGTLPEKQLISGYCDPEINWFPSKNTQKFSKKTTFVNIPWNLGKNQQISSEIFITFPGIVTRKLIDFRVLCPGSEILRKKFVFFIFNSCTTFKTDYIYKNHLWLLSTCLGLWLKKNGVI